MNSLEKMAKKEDEVALIANIYVASIKHCIACKNYIQSKRQIIYIHRVDEALHLIDECYRQVIQNDFIYRDYKWWKDIYSSERYLNIRHQAVNSFLMHFYEA